MHRFSPLALAVCFIVSQICCAPPVRAAATEAAEPMHCPIQKEECEASKPADCSGGPQLVSEVPVKKFTAPAQFQPVAVVAAVPAVAQEETAIVAGWWSAPTRTIQLRI